ncbi:AraC family transcriptional regulator [Streptomyces erythrochromogenes]|uniref:AraC family transcriptional regulator n=1 Tax=Streptomyces erythrochromogenes TaxID=285574 RepID=UPI0037F3989B
MRFHPVSSSKDVRAVVRLPWRTERPVAGSSARAASSTPWQTAPTGSPWMKTREQLLGGGVLEQRPHAGGVAARYEEARDVGRVDVRVRGRGQEGGVLGEASVGGHDGVGRIGYRPTVGPPAMHPQQVEAVVSSMVRAARWLAGDDWTPLAVSFAHPRAGSAEPYASFFGCPVTFDAPDNAIAVADADLDRRRPLYDPALNALHRAYADRLLQQLSAAGTVAERVRQWLERAPLGDAGPEGPARQLNLSSRSLRRALHAEGTSWRALLDTARHGRARRLLETTALPLDRIAPLVGLSGATALVRAFTWWEGMAPGAYRSRNRPGSPG